MQPALNQADIFSLPVLRDRCVRGGPGLRMLATVEETQEGAESDSGSVLVLRLPPWKCHTVTLARPTNLNGLQVEESCELAAELAWPGSLGY
jgi:hypothetical protein